MLNRKAPKQVIGFFALVALVFGSTAWVAAPAFSSGKQVVVIAGFAKDSFALNEEMKWRLKKFVKTNPEYSTISCVGFADRPGSASANKKLGKNRAKNSCDYVKKLIPSINVSNTFGRWDTSSTGPSTRRVSLIFSNALNGTITTSFDFDGGTFEKASIKSAPGESITLPYSFKAGYNLVGWYSNDLSKRYGDAGQKFVPEQSSTLRALWAARESSARPSPRPEPGIGPALFKDVQQIGSGFCESLSIGYLECPTLDSADTDTDGYGKVIYFYPFAVNEFPGSSFNFNTNEYPFSNLIDKANYDASKLEENASIYSEDGAKIVDVKIVISPSISNLGVAVFDEEIPNINLVEAVDVGGNPSQVLDANYLEISYDGKLYKFYLIRDTCTENCPY